MVRFIFNLGLVLFILAVLGCIGQLLWYLWKVNKMLLGLLVIAKFGILLMALTAKKLNGLNSMKKNAYKEHISV